MRSGKGVSGKDKGWGKTNLFLGSPFPLLLIFSACLQFCFLHVLFSKRLLRRLLFVIIVLVVLVVTVMGIVIVTRTNIPRTTLALVSPLTDSK